MYRRARPDDARSIVDLLATVYATDPFFRWMAPDAAGWPEFARDHLGLIVPLALRAGMTDVTDPLDAVAPWTPPGFALVGPDDLSRAQALLAEHLGDRAGLVFEGLLGARAHEPEAST